jgi:hypothetical protein
MHPERIGIPLYIYGNSGGESKTRSIFLWENKQIFPDLNQNRFLTLVAGFMDVVQCNGLPLVRIAKQKNFVRI